MNCSLCNCCNNCSICCYQLPAMNRRRASACSSESVRFQRQIVSRRSCFASARGGSQHNTRTANTQALLQKDDEGDELHAQEQKVICGGFARSSLWRALRAVRSEPALLRSAERVSRSAKKPARFRRRFAQAANFAVVPQSGT